jgi:hypothetical protein
LERAWGRAVYFQIIFLSKAGKGVERKADGGLGRRVYCRSGAGELAIPMGYEGVYVG